ncbi:MAG: OmpH family outer membrane protein [Desulfomonilaceae bacterium]|nr:OmpH family outer membrane protein [Desulfomonilaceae bacterium]
MTIHRFLTVILSLALCSAFFHFGAAPSFGEGGQTATISIEKIYGTSSRLKAAVEEVNKLRMESAGKMSTMAAAAKMIQDRLEKEAGTLKPEEKTKLEEDLEVKRAEFENEEQDLRVKIGFKQKSVENVLKTQLPEAVDKIAKEKGITMVFWERSLAYSRGLPDISADVAQELDKMPAPEKGPQ